MGRKSKSKLWIIAVVALVVATFAFVKWRGPAVAVHVVERKDMQRTVVANGRIMAGAEVKIAALATGTVMAIPFEAGTRVKAGDILLQFDQAAALAQQEQALARLAEAKAGRRGVSALDVPAAMEQLNQARERLALEQRDADRATALAANQAIAQSEVEAAQTKLRLAQSQVMAAELQLASVSAGGSSAQRASANTALAEAQLSRARVDLAQTSVRAPTDGVILQRLAEPGDVVSAGAGLFVLSTGAVTRVVIEPDERSLAQIALGQKARVSTEAFPNENFEASLSYIAPAVDPKRGTIEVRLDVKDPPAYVRPDMTVSVEILVGQEKQAIVVPAFVIKDRLQGPWVYVVKDGRVQRRHVQLGAVDAVDTQVTSGLDAGEVVVADANASLTPGQRVRVEKGTRP
jgi:HlyD family secretion protein